MKLNAIPARSWYLTLLFPLPLADTGKLIAFAAAIGAAAAIAMRDVYPLILATTLGYMCVILIGRLFAPYTLYLPTRELLNSASDLLDATPGLHREKGSLQWVRKVLAPFSSKADVLEIHKDGSGWTVKGRRLEIIALASTLNSDFSQQ